MGQGELFTGIAAVSGSIGLVVSAVISNWDKIFSNAITVKTEGYKPSGVPETELRHLLEVSGTRATYRQQMNMMFDAMEKQWISQAPDEARQIAKMMEFIRETAPTLDDIFEEISPIWMRYFTLKDIQDLNRFYSTQQMQGMLRAMPGVLADMAPVMNRMMAEEEKKIERAVASGQFLDDAEEDAPQARYR